MAATHRLDAPARACGPSRIETSSAHGLLRWVLAPFRLPPAAGSLSGMTQVLFPLNAGCVIGWSRSHTTVCENGNNGIAFACARCQ